MGVPEKPPPMLQAYRKAVLEAQGRQRSAPTDQRAAAVDRSIKHEMRLIDWLRDRGVLRLAESRARGEGGENEGEEEGGLRGFVLDRGAMCGVPGWWKVFPVSPKVATTRRFVNLVREHLHKSAAHESSKYVYEATLEAIDHVAIAEGWAEDGAEDDWTSDEEEGFRFRGRRGGDALLPW